MPTDTSQIVNKAWNYAHVLRDDGLSYMAYTEQITFLLFLKMAANHPAMWHAVAMIEESFFERRYVGDQAGPGLLARVITQYDDVALYPPAYFHPTVGESKSNPDAKRFLLAAHLFAGTWVTDRRADYTGLWQANTIGDRQWRLRDSARPSSRPSNRLDR